MITTIRFVLAILVLVGAWNFPFALLQADEPLQVISADGNPRVATDSQLTWASSGKLLLVARDRERAVIGFSLDSATARLSEVWRLTLPKNGTPSATAEIGDNTFAALDMGNGQVCIYRTGDDGTQPVLVGAASAPEREAQLRSLAVDKQRKLLYVSAEGSNLVCVWSIEDLAKPELIKVIGKDQASFPTVLPGQKRPRYEEIGSFDFPRSVVLSPDRKDVYVNCFGSHSLLHLRVDADDGLLTHAHTYSWQSPIGERHLVHRGLTYPMAIQLSGDGKHLYVGGTAQNLAAFARNPETGELSLLQLLTNDFEGLEDLLYVTSIRFSPDGRLVAVISEEGGSVILLKRGEHGKLNHWKTFRNSDFKTSVLRGVSDAVFTPDGKNIIATSSDAIAVMLPVASTK